MLRAKRGLLKQMTLRARREDMIKDNSRNDRGERVQGEGGFIPMKPPPLKSEQKQSKWGGNGKYTEEQANWQHLMDISIILTSWSFPLGVGKVRQRRRHCTAQNALSPTRLWKWSVIIDWRNHNSFALRQLKLTNTICKHFYYESFSYFTSSCNVVDS